MSVAFVYPVFAAADGSQNSSGGEYDGFGSRPSQHAMPLSPRVLISSVSATILAVLEVSPILHLASVEQLRARALSIIGRYPQAAECFVRATARWPEGLTPGAACGVAAPSGTDDRMPPGYALAAALGALLVVSWTILLPSTTRGSLRHRLSGGKLIGLPASNTASAPSVCDKQHASPPPSPPHSGARGGRRTRTRC